MSKRAHVRWEWVPDEGPKGGDWLGYRAKDRRWYRIDFWNEQWNVGVADSRREAIHPIPLASFHDVENAKEFVATWGVE